MEENFNDLFSLTPEDFKEKDSKSTNLERYKPDAKKGKDGTYKSVIRFLPWYKDPKNKSIMSKWNCWLVDPVSGDGKYVDCPSTIGGKSIIQETYFRLKKSESVADQELAKKFSRRQTFASLVQIIDDKINPELNGKIMVFQYGIKIYNKLMSEMQPEMGKPHVPFDLFEGKPFFLNLKIVADYNNYDDCKFLDEKSPIKIDGEEIEKTNEGVQKVVEYLKANSPDLEKYGYHPWTDEITEFVNTCIKNIVPKGKLVADLAKTTSTTKTKKTESIFKDDVVTKTSKQKEHITEPNLDNEELSFDEISFDNEDFDEELYSKL